ncbi:hypothetical protein BH24ACI5_BH24ACI5_06910 [soil metagenome]
MGLTTPVRILVADDQVDILDALRLLLTDEGYEVTAARSPGEALERLRARHDGDVRLAAQQLGMSRSALYRRLQQYGVTE